jgi:putative acetyltransferase
MEITLLRTTSDSNDFRRLIRILDKELTANYGEDQKEYDKHNHIEDIHHVLVAYADNEPAGCGCFRITDNQTVEMKRIFVKKELRGRGISKSILWHLETWAMELQYRFAILETGILQLEAVHLYLKSGYLKTPNYEPYIGNKNSICMRKKLNM